MFRLLTAHGFFNTGRAFIGPVLTVYLLQHGISLTTIALAKAIQLVVSVLFNYPAGKIADKFGKKTSIILSCLFSAIYFALMLMPSDETVILGEIFNGLAIAFYMGAYEAWVFEFKNEKENSFSLITRSSEVLLLSSILASIIGALYFQHAIYFSLIFMAIAIPLYLRTPQKPIMSQSHSLSFFGELKQFIQSIDNKLLFFLCFGGSMQLIYQLWAVFLGKDIGIKNEQLGYILGGMFAIQWLFSFISRKVKLNQKPYVNKLVFSGVTFFSLLTIFCFLAEYPHWLIAVSFIIFSGFCGLTMNLYFAQSCQIFSNQRNESSMISLIDTNVRLFGATLLGIYALLQIQTAVWVWLVFPVIIGIYQMSQMLKK